MNITMESLIKKYDLIKLLEAYKKVYIRGQGDVQFEERIKYRINSKDWIIYVDGNTIRDFIRGFAVCSSGIVGCDDNGELFFIEMEKICFANISNTTKSLLINGHSITLGAISHCLAEKLILICKDIRMSRNKTVSKVRLVSFPDKLWYIGYDEQILGPFSEKEIQSFIDIQKYNLDAMFVWSSHMQDWELVKNVSEFNFVDVEVEEMSQSQFCVDVNHCGISDLLRLPGISRKRAEKFLERRSEGIWIKNMSDMQKEFGLNPHEVDYLSSFLTFKIPVTSMKNRRVLDV